jgi:Rps23 Pro-64 3,4-dihydroxylase Tpa1-like proline 4-hydroxylase
METPFLIVDNFYNREEQRLIWTELDFHKDNFVIDKGTVNHGVATDNNGKSIGNLSRIYLDEIYDNKREQSNILHCYQKLFIKEIINEYKEKTLAARTFETTNTDWSQVSYYENNDNYDKHFDEYMHSCLIWFYRKPKRFDGGDLIFTDLNATVKCKHNRMILFPSYYCHKVNRVTMKEQYRNRSLGRFCLTHFFSKK